MKLPTLFKKTSTGAIQFWEIEVLKALSRGGAESVYPDFIYGVIETTYGQVGTDSPQTTKDSIQEGKNLGKKNETSAYEQAELEAKSQWEKKKKSGYVESIEAAQADELDDLIEGGIVPMLAQSFAKQGHKIKFPCYVQPKLDGIRCIAILKDGKCTLWSRTRKPITSCPHIIEELERNFTSGSITLDGELYNHDFKDNFEHIVHLVRQEEPDSGCRDVQYHVYDMVDSSIFSHRTSQLYMLIANHLNFEYTRFVPTHQIQSEEEVPGSFVLHKHFGYEGSMLRNADSLYVNKRSADLQKVKEFQDEEFDITGIEEGRGKLAGHVGAFICKMANGGSFSAKMSGETERLRDYFEDHSLWEGKRLTVKFQGLTGKEKVPRFPVGVCIRDYE